MTTHRLRVVKFSQHNGKLRVLLFIFRPRLLPLGGLERCTSAGDAWTWMRGDTDLALSSCVPPVQRQS